MNQYLVYAAAAVILGWPYLVKVATSLPALLPKRVGRERWKAKWLDTLLTLEELLEKEGNADAVQTVRTLCIQIVHGGNPK